MWQVGRESEKILNLVGDTYGLYLVEMAGKVQLGAVKYWLEVQEGVES